MIPIHISTINQRTGETRGPSLETWSVTCCVEIANLNFIHMLSDHDQSPQALNSRAKLIWFETDEIEEQTSDDHNFYNGQV